MVVVHADHFDKHYTTDQNILWNNFYEYQFQHAKYVDSFIVATNEQKKILKINLKNTIILNRVLIVFQWEV